MQLTNAKVLNADFSFALADVTINEAIEKVTPTGSERQKDSIDLKGKYLIPGLVDTHTHGAIGMDAMDYSIDFPKWKEYLMKNGITTFLPTTVTATYDEIRKALAHLKDGDGINLEGPFLSPHKKGAHDDGKMVPVDLDFLKEIKDQVKITTIAPEVADNLDKIKAITDMGIKVSIGHTEINYEMSKQAFENGATVVTHLFNAMNGLFHREPGLVGAALENKAIFCEVIADGFHLHSSVLTMLYHMLGADRMLLISDGMAATGLSDGAYKLGGLDITVKDRLAKTQDGAIAGSTFHLMDMVRNMVKFGVPLADAVKMASLTPARAVGMEDEVGSIAVGKKANLVVLNESLDVEQVYYLGNKVSL